jgi:hypothetical protein
LRKAGIQVDPMEEWAAASDEPKKFSQERIEGCDLCVLMVAFRRGHVPEGEVLSVTQLEYQAARRLGLPVLVFMLAEDAPWPRKFDELEKDPGIKTWRAELREHHGVGTFLLAPESVEIAPALTRWIADKLRPVTSVTRVGQGGAKRHDNLLQKIPTKRSLSQEDCVGRWRLEVDGDLVEIRLEADGSWIATAPGEGVLSNLVKRYQGEWSVKNGFLRITQTRFGIPLMSGPLRDGSSTWVAGRIREITEHRIVLQDGTTLNAV